MTVGLSWRLSFGGVKLIVHREWRFCVFTVVAIGTIFTDVIPVAFIFDVSISLPISFTLAIIRATASSTVSTIIVAFTTVFHSRGVVSATRWSGTATTGRAVTTRAIAATFGTFGTFVAITSRLEAPGC